MHEFRASEPVKIRQVLPELNEGEVQYREYSARMLVIESRGFTPADGASAAFEFLFAGDVEIDPGSQIVWRGGIYDVANVKVCRDLDGKIRARRCTVCT